MPGSNALVRTPLKWREHENRICRRVLIEKIIKTVQFAIF